MELGTNENKDKVRWNHDTSIEAAAVGEKAVEATFKSVEIKDYIALASIKLCLQGWLWRGQNRLWPTQLLRSIYSNRTVSYPYRAVSYFN